MQKILDCNWDEIQLREAGTILDHLRQCEQCRTALADYDQIRSVLKVSENEGEPNGGWLALENHLFPLRKMTPSLRWISKITLAASLFFVLGFGGGYWWFTQKPENSGVFARGPAQLSTKDINQQVAMFDQISRIYEGKAGWVAVSDKTSDVGVISDKVLSRPQLLLLRLTMSQKKTVVSQADLVIIPGQTAELRVPFFNDQALKYRIRTSSSEPTNLTVWVEVEKPNQDGEVIAALATTLHISSGEVRSAGQMVTSTGGYDLKIAFSKATKPERK